MKHYAEILNNFLHDMATGTWAACLLVIYVLTVRSGHISADAAAVIDGALHAVFALFVGALAVVTLTGAIRMRYWRRATPDFELPYKRRALVLKHTLFIIVYASGTWWGWSLVR